MKKLQLIFVSLLLLSICTTGNLWAQQAAYTHKEDVIYGRRDGMALTMDVFQPENPNGIGVLVMISGGWYSSHDRIQSEWLDRIKQLINHGQTVFAIVHASAPKYKVPEIKLDINRAVRYVRFHAKEWNVDPECLGIVGESSGGHLSLLQAATGTEGDPKAKDSVEMVSSKLEAVACFFPPVDLTAFGRMGSSILLNPRYKHFILALTSSPIDSVELLKVATEVSPIRYITKSLPPTLIISGSADKTIPVQQSQFLAKKLEELGVPHRLEIREGKDHGWPDIAKDYNDVADWFNQYLQKK
jgi:acetyl esterase/lipase